MNAATRRPGAKLITVMSAMNEYGLTRGRIRALITARDLRVVEIPHSRSIYLLREDLDRLVASAR